MDPQPDEPFVGSERWRAAEPAARDGARRVRDGEEEHGIGKTRCASSPAAGSQRRVDGRAPLPLSDHEAVPRVTGVSER
jgi:hypothetical protein